MRLVAVLGHAAPVVRAVSLADLYFCVPAAEEEDLLEQHAVEQHQEWLLREYAPWIDIDLTEPEPAKPDVDAGDVDTGDVDTGQLAYRPMRRRSGSCSTSSAPTC